MREIKGKGWIGTGGYRYCSVGDGKQSLMHRVLWENENGPIPDGMVIDHINRDKTDNRMENLRLTTKEGNNYNRIKEAKGCYFNKGNGRWMARIGTRYLGYYDSEQAATAAYLIERDKREDVIYDS